MKKKVLLLVAMIMVLSLFSVVALAADEEDTAYIDATENAVDYAGEEDMSDEPLIETESNPPFENIADVLAPDTSVFEESIMTLASSSSIVASGTCGDSVNWQLNGDGVLTISGSGDMTNDLPYLLAPWYSYCGDIKQVIIEDDITSIGNYVFYDCSSLKSVTIPDSVTSIGSSAFSCCSNLKEVHINDFEAWKKITFGDNDANPLSNGAKLYLNGTLMEFKGTGSCGKNVSWVLSDDGILTIFGIGDMANYSSSLSVPLYSYRGDIKQVIIEDGITSIGNYVFYGCSSLKSVTIPDSVTSIGDNAFRGCSSLESVTIPDGMTSIGSSAFSGCSLLTSITIPDSVKSIGSDAFSGCSNLKEVYINDFEAWKKITFGNDSANPLNNGAKLYINGTLMEFKGMGSCGKTVSWVLSDDGVLTISGSGAMTNYSSASSVPWNKYSSDIKTVAIEDGVTSIGAYAFYDCSLLLSITIPDSVTSIGGWTFCSCSSLTSVTIPESVTSIGASAFSSCSNLKEVHINDFEAWKKITFGNDSANPLNNGAKLYINGTLMEFKGMGSCGKTVSWVLSEDGILTISGSGAMTNYSPTSPWDSYRSQIKAVNIEDGVTSIGDWAFSSCSSLTSITIPNSVTSIGACAFYDCSLLLSITIPDSVTSIGSSAFERCFNLKEVHITDLVAWKKISFSDNDANPLSNGAKLYLNGDLLDLKSTGNCGSNVYYTLTEDGILTISGSGDMANYSSSSSVPWYSYRGDIKQVIIEDGITSIGNSVFYGCSLLLSITIPDSVTSIGYDAFSGCSSLESISIPESVKNIGNFAFSGCSSLPSVAIPDGVKSIGDCTFSGCSSLTLVTIPESVTSIGMDAFYGCSNLKEVHINDFEAWKKITFGNDSANPLNNGAKLYINGTLMEFKGMGSCGKTVSWVLSDDGVLTISGSGAMTNYSSASSVPWNKYSSDIKTVAIEDGVTSIGAYAFDGCSKLTSLTMSNSITFVGSNAFSSYYHIAEVHISDLSAWCKTNFADADANPLSATTQLYLDGDVLFPNGKLISKLEIPNGVTTIGSYVFAYYSSLTSVTIPSSVTSIGEGSFYNCSSLKSVTIPDSVASIGEAAFYYCSSLESVTIPDGVTSIGDDTFLCCSSLKSVTIPDSMVSIGREAFCGCSSLESVTIPESVTSIGMDAFYGCSKLTSAHIDNLSLVRYKSEFDKTKTALYWNNKRITNGNTCGDDAYWAIFSDGLMKIVGTGRMFNYDSAVDTWTSQVRTLEIDEGITYIGNHAFADCSLIRSVSLPDSLETIGSYAFKGCSSLTSLKMSNNVSVIGSNAFYNCNSLGTVRLSNIINTINNDAFYGCSSLHSVYIKNLSVWRGIKFGNPYANPLNNGASLYYEDCGDNIEWDLEDDGTLRIYGSGAMYNYTSSSLVPWSSLTYLIKKVEIEDGITTVGDYAFSDCRYLDIVSLPDSIQNIGSYAFSNCVALPEIKITDSVTYIGNNAFAGCSLLKSVYIKDQDTWENISFGNDLANPLNNGGKIYFGENIREVVDRGNYGSNVSWRLYTDGTLELIGSGQTSGSGAYLQWKPYINQIKRVKISEGITSIGQLSFEGCTSLVSVELPTTLKVIGPNVFNKCMFINEVHVKDLAAWNRITFNGNTSDPTYYGATLYLDGTCGDNLEWSLADNGTLTIYGTGAMDDYLYQYPSAAPWASELNKIKNVVIKEGVTSIGGYAFIDCPQLKSVTLPNSLQFINSCAFAECWALKDVYIDDFEAWSNIKFADEMDNPLYYGATLHWNGNPSGTCGDNIIWNLNSADGTLTISGSGAMYDYDTIYDVNAPWDSYSQFIKKITIEYGVTSIGNSAFYGCKNLTSVSIPSSVTSLGEWSFCDCESLTSVVLPSSINEMGCAVFYGCSNLKSVNIPSGITVLDNTFSRCTSLTSITIPNGVTSILGAFSECTSLKSLTLPQSITEIGISTFMDCTSLTSINLPKGIKVIPTSAFNSCSSLKTIVIPDGVTSIETDAFDGCTSLTTITIPASVTSIGAYALGTKTGVDYILKDVYYGGSPSQWKRIDIGMGNLNLSEYGDTTIHYAKTDSLLGDVNDDGKISYVDYMLALRYVKKQGTLTEEQLLRADVAGNDGKVTYADYMKILRIFKGLE